MINLRSVAVISFLFFMTTGCVATKWLKPEPQTINRRESVPDFSEFDINKDGTVTPEEHATAKEKIEDEQKRKNITGPYVVFAIMMASILIICGLAGVRYGKLATTVKEKVSLAVNKFKNRKKKNHEE